MNWYNFLLKIKPDGKAFRSIFNTKTLLEVMADAIQIIQDYAVLNINDQVWYVNDNFDPAPWEARYGIIPPEFSSLEERRLIVKSYMLYPQSGNRLSKDYMQNYLIEKGFINAILEYNPTNITNGYLHFNDSGNEKISFPLGPLVYNTFIVSGGVPAVYYEQIINILMGLKPLQVGFYDNLSVFSAIAYDETLTLAIDDTYTLAISTL